MTELPSPEEYVAKHRQAFRTAFDFLNAHFPPEHDSEWWEKTSFDLGTTAAGAGENELTKILLLAVTDYLEQESKLRREHES